MRTMGSGNIGAANVIRNLGIKWGALVLLLDLLKSFVPLLIVKSCFTSPLLISLFAIFLVFGHNFSPFLMFKGGKGVATTMGVYFALALPILPWVVIVYVLTLVLTGFSSLASLFALLFVPFVLFFFKFPTYIIYLSIFLFLLALTRHKDNILRLWRCEEKPLFPLRRR